MSEDTEVTAVQKDSVSRWLPSIVAVIALLVHVVVVARWSASVDERIRSLESKTVPVERLYELFPTRVEWSAQLGTQNSVIADLRAMVRDTNAKVDALYQLQLRSAPRNEPR